MSYEGAYQREQRPYAGPPTQRPSPIQGSGHYKHTPSQRHDCHARQPQYDGFQLDYIYDYYDDGGGRYESDYNGHYTDSYQEKPPPDQRNAPQQGSHGSDMGRPGRRGRLPIGPWTVGPAPMSQPRAGAADGVGSGAYTAPGAGGRLGRGMGYSPITHTPGRGGGRAPFPRAPISDLPQSHSSPLMSDNVQSPGDYGFSNTFPGHQGSTDFENEHQIMERMAGMNLSQRPQIPMGRDRGGSQRSGMRSSDREHHRPPIDAPLGPSRVPPQSYDGRLGPGAAPGPSASGYGPLAPHDSPFENDDGSYGPAPRPPDALDEGFGPPPRSMTITMNVGTQNRGPLQSPQRMDSNPYTPPPNHRIPQRPSTSHGNRPPPQRLYPPSAGPPFSVGYSGAEHDGKPATGGPPHQNTRASLDAALVACSAPPAPDSSSMYYLNGAPPQQSRASLDLHMGSEFPPGPAPSGGQPSAPSHHGPDMMRTKSQPDLRKQGGSYEMEHDAPPMPVPQNGIQSAPRPGPSFSYYNGPHPHSIDNIRRRPSAGGLPNNPAMMRSGGGMPRGPSPPQSNNPDALPSHPTPVRPGLMADSMVSVASSRHPPARTYSSPPPVSASSVSDVPSLGSTLTTQQQQQQQAIVTADELERLRVIVKADPNDQETALRLAKRLVEASEVLVPNVADPKTRSRARERYLVDAHKILKKLASAQNMEAMFFFADCLGRGLFGSEPDNKEAFTLYQSAAKMGHAAAAYRTAVCCEIGHEEGGGTRKDPLKAIQWYKRAATLGDTPAMYKMGMIQLKGLLGQAKNPREAVGWLKRAAERADAENPHALHELGLLYESAQPNDAILRDEQYAFSLFRQAAELGYKFAQFRLGCAYEYGLMGCPIDPRLSIMWYSKAATQQEHQSELALSGWYLTGTEGVLAQSDTEAYLWARKAAMAGLAKAEYAMGYFTEVGIGVPANMEDAKRWYWRAAAQDFPKARERLEDLKRTGKNGPRQRERISRSKIGRQQEGECTVM